MKLAIRKSQPFVLLLYILAIIIIGVAFAILSQPMGQMYNANYAQDAVQDDIYQNFFTRTRTIFIWLPLLLIVPTIIWLFIKAQEKQQGYA